MNNIRWVLGVIWKFITWFFKTLKNTFLIISGIFLFIYLHRRAIKKKEAALNDF